MAIFAIKRVVKTFANYFTEQDGLMYDEALSKSKKIIKKLFE